MRRANITMVSVRDLKDRGVPFMPWRVRSDLAEATIGRAVDWLTASRMRAIAALLVLAFACFLPGIATIPPLDVDEASFAQSTKQMLETGNYIDIRLGDQPRYNKPVGIYWLQAALVRLAGYGSDAPIWAYRLASLLGATAAVLLTYWAALPLFGARAAFIAGAAMALSVILTTEAHLAKTDAVLAATVALTMGALGRLYLWRAASPAPLGLALLFWLGLALGILVKGPIAPMVAALTIGVLVVTERRVAWLKRLRPAIGIPLCLAIVLPWFVAILSVAGVDFLHRSVGTDLLGKVAIGQETHGAPPGSHFLAFWIIFWPTAVLAIVALPWVWQNRRDPAVRFCLAWIVPSWLVFEAVVTKLLHYTLPTYPAIAALIGAAVAAGARPVDRLWSRIALFLPVILAVAMAFVVTYGSWRLQGTLGSGLVALALLTAALAVAATAAALRTAYRSAMALMAAATVSLYVAAFGVAIPHLDVIRLSPRLAEAIERDAPCANPAILSAGYKEPSLLFAAGTGVRFGDARDAAAFLADGGCRVVLVAAPLRADFVEQASKLHLTLDKHETISGTTLDRVGLIDVGVYTATSPTGSP